MTFLTIEAARNARDKFHAEFGSSDYVYIVETCPRGFQVSVYSQGGNFLTFV